MQLMHKGVAQLHLAIALTFKSVLPIDQGLASVNFG